VQRIMFDSNNPDAIPANPPMVAAYVDGLWGTSYARARIVFPHARVLSIAVFPWSNALILDCEPDNPHATPDAAVAWAVRQRKVGTPYPWVYCNELDTRWGMPAVRAAFDANRVRQPLYWTANYSRPAGVLSGTIGHQYRSTTGYDLSVMADYIPGIDPRPVAPSTKDDDMRLIHDENGSLSILIDGPDFWLLQNGDRDIYVAAGVEDRPIAAVLYASARARSRPIQAAN
jgi:hypothetical protein